MNSIGSSIPQDRGIPAGPVGQPLAMAAQEQKGPDPVTDGVVLTRPPEAGAVAGPGRLDVPAGQTVTAMASESLAVAQKCAAAVVGGPAGHVLGVTISDLNEQKKEVEKGYHLPDNYICGYFDRRILPYQDRPSYKESDGSFYRGMYITVDELAHILESGFEVKRNTWSAVGGQGIYVTTSEREAEDYIFQATDPSKKNAIGVVFKMERGDYASLVVDPDCNSTNTIYKAPEDVPGDKITGVYLKGQYGLESLEDVIARARQGEIKPNTSWVNQFDSYLGR